ncbi:GntT/GntP/DsdX family permease [Flavihumibacter petaseus]|uniref:High-affinity gluconate transporter GntT n=1 Tax=Flavihumibacter petaseus NBRC 106054 TaxID=1220578 RepID=A0A0E9N0Z3_9BACT|nr:gluconate:H+ symporter [Flavihumibacter petaseus]GAO43428.1 high-affinity gluconate transporter GntT [Flavihumibacter petaseus NBRC 106054]
MSVLIIVLAIGLLFWLTLNKVLPFIALLLVTILIGLAFGMSLNELLKAMQDGIGSMLGSMALILCFGAIQGRLLEKTGAATVISRFLMDKLGRQHIQWAVLLMGFLVGIPLFYNAGFVILVPFVFTIAASARLPLLYVAIPTASALSVTHGFLPPHPGPVGLAAIFHASIGKTILYGLLVAVPTVCLAGVVFGRRFRHHSVMPREAATLETTEALPPVGRSIAVSLLPVFLIAMSAGIGPFLPEESLLRTILAAIGDPVIALMITVGAASWFLGWARGVKTVTIMDHYGKAIESVAIIMMVIAAGGALKEVLTKSGVAAEVAGFISGNQFPPLVAGWLVAAGIRVVIGSATIAGLTAAGILAPLVAAGSVSPEWMLLSCGAGSLFCSHVNDTGFWMFKEYFGLTVKETLLSWTMMETIISVAGLLLILLFSCFV